MSFLTLDYQINLSPYLQKTHVQHLADASIEGRIWTHDVLVQTQVSYPVGHYHTIYMIFLFQMIVITEKGHGPLDQLDELKCTL